MKISIITSINDEGIARELVPGTVVSLEREPDNPKDPNAVKALWDGEFVGYVANKCSTIPQDCSSAALIAKQLTKPEVAGINARLLSSYERRIKKEGQSAEICQTCWLAEPYFIPVWNDGGKAEEKETYELTVSGPATNHSKKAHVISNFGTLAAGDLVLKLVPSSLDGKSVATVYPRSSLEALPAEGPVIKALPASAGEVSDVPDAVMLVLQSGAVLPLAPVATAGSRSYRVSVSLDPSDMDVFIPEMDKVVRSCILQVRDVKERVSYLLAQHVPEPIVRGVLTALRPLSEDEHVDRPKRMYAQIGGDTTLTRALGYYLAGKDLRLVGEKGTGKNTLISSVCWALAQPLCRIQGNADLDKLDLMGSTVLDEKGTSFELSSFVKALQSGGDVVLDEINAVKPEVALILHSLADDARSIEIPNYGRVTVHPRSHIWATMNEDYIGTGELNDATADRFVPLFLDQQSNIRALLKELFPEVEEKVLTICGSVYDQILKAVHEGRCSSSAITTRGYIDAIESLQYLSIRQTLLDNIAGRPSDKEDRQAIANFINAVCPAGTI